MKLDTIKTLWGNSSFDYALRSSLGNSVGILCVWEPTLFFKDNVTSSDNFLAVIATQKSKVRWTIEGDENTKFFHGIHSSKRSELAIRRTLVDGEWIVDPLAVKNVFLKYFSARFSSPVSSRICFADQFTNMLSLEQQADLERNVTN
nr:RNA-directed DNA polymerase, eukaryota [Tanacetum cinerariifolium]